ncbi:hypothetical protein EDD22DRAFT_269291 [Suillus occidentalis]|nr:hypothetical protein EDD22DRAFT_269291 [Suillus occidentalis]
MPACAVPLIMTASLVAMLWFLANYFRLDLDSRFAYVCMYANVSVPYLMEENVTGCALAYVAYLTCPDFKRHPPEFNLLPQVREQKLFMNPCLERNSSESYLDRLRRRISKIILALRTGLRLLTFGIVGQITGSEVYYIEHSMGIP